MSTLIRSIKNEGTVNVTLRVPGFDPTNLITVVSGATVDLLPLLTADEFTSMQAELADLVASGKFSTQDTVDSSSLIGTVSNSQDYSGAHSYQAASADLTLSAGAGSSTDPKYLAASMWNLFGGSLTKTKPYLGGVIGAYSITGTLSTTYPAGAVLAQITDGVTEADGAVVAYIDGDSALTTANAAFKVMNNNSTPGSGFHWGLDLSGATHDGYPAVAFLDGEVRFSNGTKVTVSGDTIVFTNAGGTKHVTLTMIP